MIPGRAVELFDGREHDYLAWVQAHPDGFVANVDRAQVVPQYPMIHRASHGAVSSPRIGNFTTGDYLKFCAVDLVALERYLESRFSRPATYCRQCMRKGG